MGSRGQVKKNPAARQRQSSILSAFLNLQRVRQTELYRKCWMSLLHTYEKNFKIDSCPFKKKSIQLYQFNESPSKLFFHAEPNKNVSFCDFLN